ncbi:THAP domain-containing protein 11 [Rhinatrema bivittatum]|uniref:THAP domain-containing protein 11 n=1 Tax=Rhinatrema bivittatum TaxID=194408 RepID=UPI00112E04D3|nr:THAP domain-containing protein 11 [Rhinatrema bivittatum]
MPGFTCCVPGCYSNSHRDKALHFYTFPKDPELRRLWLKNVSRAGVSGCFSTFHPTTGHRVCSLHFPGGRKTYSVRVPTIFPLRGVNEKKTRRGGGAGSRKQRLHPGGGCTTAVLVATIGGGDDVGEQLEVTTGEADVITAGGGEDTKPMDLTVQVEGSGVPEGPGSSSSHQHLRVVLVRDDPDAAAYGYPAFLDSSSDHSYSLSSGTTSEELLRKLNEQRDIIALMEVKMKEMKASIRHLRVTEVKLREEIREKDRQLSIAVIRKKHGM